MVTTLGFSEAVSCTLFGSHDRLLWPFTPSHDRFWSRVRGFGGHGSNSGYTWCGLASLFSLSLADSQRHHMTLRATTFDGDYSGYFCLLCYFRFQYWKAWFLGYARPQANRIYAFRIQKFDSTRPVATALAPPTVYAPYSSLDSSLPPARRMPKSTHIRSGPCSDFPTDMNLLSAPLQSPSLQTFCSSPSAVPELTFFPVFLIFSSTSPYPSSGLATTSTFCVSSETSYDLMPVHPFGSALTPSHRRTKGRRGIAEDPVIFENLGS